jgi:starch phosphorylase
MSVLFDRYLGPDWRRDPLTPGIWDELLRVPDEELWRVHERRRTRLVVVARQRLERQLAARGAAKDEIEHAEDVLNPEALTIGFARRFATYKRATLLFRDIERLKRLLQNREQPVQFIFAGKAHPRDDEGKKFIRDLIHAAHDSDLRARFIFLEDYDMNLSRYIVQGVDVWLNTPRRPLEASGTSGMKAVANGAIHLSTLDGWWAEAHSPELGWAIGKGEDYADTAYQDQVEGEALYELLENEIVPLFFRRTVSELPKGWVALMKRSMAALIPQFASHRMVRDYVQFSYLPAHACQARLSDSGAAAARELASWRNRVLSAWDSVRIEQVTNGDTDSELQAGGRVEAEAIINPGHLSADDFCVEIYHGRVGISGDLEDAQGTGMELEEVLPDGRFRYRSSLELPLSGYYGFTVRVYPSNPLLGQRLALAKMRWSD